MNTPQENKEIESQEIGKEERTWATFVHLGGLASYMGIPFGNLLVPYIIFLIKRKEMPYLKQEGTEALNFNLTVLLGMLLSAFLLTLSFIPILGFLSFFGGMLALVILVAHVSLIIIASLKANDGEGYRYPYTIRFFS